jgi:transcriptional regulator with PAS, ATPase and Fis domain
MARSDSTVDHSYFKAQTADGPPRPGALLVHTMDGPRCGPLPIGGAELILGRDSLREVVLDDRSMSRRHARVTFEQGRFVVEDLGSRNGLVLDGATVGPGQRAEGGRVLRIGRTLFVLCADLSPWSARPLRAEGNEIVGPVLARAWEAVEHAARTSAVLHLRAESGAGKELAARRFHTAGPRPKGPFIAVNCAAIPEGVAERLLFGARKGAYSGATADAQGYFEAANGGTLFLDEVAELELDVQAKLLRAVETKEIVPLGDSQPRRVELSLVSATHADLKEAVAAKRFRDDLFFRLGRPAVELPPLRERPEELGFFIQAALRRIEPSLQVGADLVEACLLREWPGNVRELVAEVEDATRRAKLAGAASVDASHLDAEAGRAVAASDGAGSETNGPRKLPADELIEAALKESNGRVATAARALGVHRNQLRRWLDGKRGTG